MQQLKARVDELALSNEHHLRLKDMNHKAKMLEVDQTELIYYS
jgi:hypothetical protein